MPKSEFERAPPPFINESKDLKDWIIVLPKNAETEDQSPGRQKILERLCEETKLNRQQLGEKMFKKRTVALPAAGGG